MTEREVKMLYKNSELYCLVFKIIHKQINLIDDLDNIIN
jgi:hypothetical protein